MSTEYILGIDTGGTFTDCSVIDETGDFWIGKHLTTYDDFKRGVFGAIEDTAEQVGVPMEELLSKTVFVGHGTTIGTNAIINRAFDPVALLTTAGQEDVCLIMRGGARTDGLNELEVRRQSLCKKPEALLARHMIVGVNERVACDGNAVIPLNEAEVKEQVDELVKNGAKAIAVCLLWSFMNEDHERRIKAIIQENHPDVYVVISSDIAPQIREYARTMTVIIDACIGGTMKKYIEGLNSAMMEKGLKKPISIMHAYGGSTSSSTFIPVSTIESGPVGGVIGAKLLASTMGEENIISTDVGGTSFDVSVLHGREWTFKKEPILMRFRVSVPIIDISCIGAGGGTVAKMDPIMGFRVGPESVGSDPGPVCYGHGGTSPTVTDADLVLGYLNPDFFYRGKMKLDKDAAAKAIEEQIAKPLGISTVQAASGIYDIVNSYMTDNLRQAVIQKGYDPREFSIIAYGGNGPMHVGVYAQELGVKKAIVPFQSPVFSAFGIAGSDIVRVYRRTRLLQMPANPDDLNDIFNEMEAEAIEGMLNEGFIEKDIDFKRDFECRYNRQVNEVGVPIKTGRINEADIKKAMDDWEEKYDTLYGKGSGLKEAGIQAVNFRSTATAKYFKPILKPRDTCVIDNATSVKGTRPAFFKKYNDYVETPIHDFSKIEACGAIKGPAIIESELMTTVVNPDQSVVLDEFRNIIFDTL